MRARAFAVIGMLMLGGCAGGGVVPDGHTKPEAAVSVKLLVPGPSQTAGRVPNYISAGTQSVSINGQAFNVTPSSSSCSSVSSGLECTFTVDAPVGPTVQMAINTYDKPLAADGSVQGDILSTASVIADVVEGSANVLKITLEGVPAKVTLVISNPSPPIGTAATIPVNVTAYDAAGYAIAGQFSSPILFGVQNAYNLNLAVNGVEGAAYQKPSDTAAIAYTGHGAVDATITAELQFSTSLLGSAAFTPQATFGSEFNVGTSLVGASAYRDSSYLHQTWFTEPAKSKIATYPQGGSIAEYAVPSGGAPLRLTGSPMNMMFTEANAIGSISDMASVVIFEHSLPTSNAGLYQIGGWDASNNTYFTEKNAAKIGKMDVYGNITEFPTGNARSTPAGMTWCDGTSWWFADPGANAIGRVTNAGGVTYYPVPTSGAQPTEISNNDGTYNGHWWFTEPGANKIASLDVNGHITEYGSPDKPVAIVADYDAIFVLTASGTIEEYDPATGALKSTATVPSSSYGPPVGIFDGNDTESLMLLRSDGTQGAIQPFWYQ